MSVRRLADDSIQPPVFAFSNDNEAWARKRISLYPEGRQQSAVIPLLMRAQDQEGWLTRAAIERVAEMLGMPYIRVLEVATFYTQFLLKPVGRLAHVQVCGTTPCMLRGAEALREVCERRIHSDSLTPSADGTLSWEEVECLGACVNAPMVAIGKDTYEDLTPERLEEIIEAFAQGHGSTIKPGPQNGRTASEAITGRTTLLDPDADSKPATPGGAPAAPQEPTNKAKPRDVSEESAPAFKGPAPQAKVSEAKAEAERKDFDKRAGGGEPNTAMREGATGAESSGGKAASGRAPGKGKRGVPAEGASNAGTGPSRSDTSATTGKADTDTTRLPGASGQAVQREADRPVEHHAPDDEGSREVGTRERGGRTQGAEDVAGVDGDKPGKKD